MLLMILRYFSSLSRKAYSAIFLSVISLTTAKEPITVSRESRRGAVETRVRTQHQGGLEMNLDCDRGGFIACGGSHSIFLQGYRKGTSLIGFALHTDLATVKVRQPLEDGESQAAS